MNLLETAGFRFNKGVIISRTERIKREGSPRYIWQVPVTAATATSVIHVPTQFPASRKYEPLDSLEIVNNEATNDLIVTINNADAYSCPAGTIRTIKGKGIALWHIAVTNNGGADTTFNLITLTLQKEPMTIDKWVANQ